MNENVCMGYKNFHTIPCLFTAPDTHKAYVCVGGGGGCGCGWVGACVQIIK